MSHEFFLKEGIVYVRLFDTVDGCDVMHVHNAETFLDLARSHHLVVYDYSDAKEIKITMEDVEAFAKLAIFESQLTPELVIGVIPKDQAHRIGTEHYQSAANKEGANIRIINDIEDLRQK